MNIPNPFQHSVSGPRVERVRHDLKRRSLQVESVTRLTPGMLRIAFSGEDLADFTSLAFDDHVKIFAPATDGKLEARDYTPRRFDPQTRTLIIDFAVHEGGPATHWALGALPGDVLDVGGPRGSKVIAADQVRRWLLIGDETALPAIGRHVEESGPRDVITSVVAVASSEERQDFKTEAQLTALWTHRSPSTANDPSALLAVVRTLRLQPDTFVWIAGEANVAKTLRSHFIDERRHPAGWTKAAGYWVMGRPDAHEDL